ncbi:MAG TPA: UDP-N-acetylmuramoyl-tripeptide--D-alanyl-D-alanine ligase [Candidatus Paceibacterota bacterium]|nr:UDP-N-acetylmuramoyl-tripeptide--D-alanyl-D-alanine ligase [Candidatus Paceibacterota bacterium]
MRTLLKQTVAALLAAISRAVVAKYRPTIVMVTGSVGKTSTKDAIAAALSERIYLRASEKGFNTEFGVPLTIIGVKNPWGSALGWLGVMKEGLALIFLPNHYPKLLVLEVGADKPGDLHKVLHIATPDVVVVTRLPEVPVHVEAYASPEAVREEEFVPAYGLAPGAPLIISAEDEYAAAYAKRLSLTIHTFGTGKDADVRIENADIMFEGGRPAGMQAEVTLDGVTGDLVVRGALGPHQMLAPAAAIATANALGIPFEHALKGLASYFPPPGRMHILAGQKDTVLIDDSYNSSPIAAEEALQALKSLPQVTRRIAVMGDMLELGRFSVEEHERIGRVAAETCDVLITVGVRSRAMAEAARTAGLANVHSFTTGPEAAELLHTLIQPGDAILMKGSQNNIRLERVVESLLADPNDVSKLVRQDKEWKVR